MHKFVQQYPRTIAVFIINDAQQIDEFNRQRPKQAQDAVRFQQVNDR